MNKIMVNVELVLHGDDFDLQSISERLGLTPTELWKKGALVEGKKIVIENAEIFQGYTTPITRKGTAWCLNTGYEETSLMLDPVHKLANIIGDKKEEIIKLQSEENIEVLVSFIVYVHDDSTPAPIFDKDMVTFFHSINAAVDIDMKIAPYGFYSDEEDEESEEYNDVVKMTTAFVELEVFGDDFEPQVITSRLNLSPTTLRMKDDSIITSKIHNLDGSISYYSYTRRKKTSWYLGIEEEESCDISEQARKLMELFEDKKDILLELQKEEDVEIDICFVAYVRSDKPSLIIKKEFFAFAHAINATIDMDLYFK